MPNLTYQIALQHESGLPEDQFVNVLYFDVAGVDSPETNADDIAAVYTTRSNFFAGGIDGLTIKVYEEAGGAPTLSKSYGMAGGSGDAPYEVAVCLSYYADDAANASARRRGRIYVGPFNAVAGARPDSTLRDMVLDMGEEFAGIGTAANTTWKMRSRINDAYYTIERIAVDDAWDTQRRRGLAPSLREFRDVQQVTVADGIALMTAVTALLIAVRALRKSQRSTVGGLSAHFDASEFGGPVSPRLVRRLERLRSLCGDRPLVILSGFRSPAHNASVGGAVASQHLYGRAADLREGYATVAQAEQAGFTGIGSRGRWAVHVDVRPGPPVRWRY